MLIYQYWEDHYRGIIAECLGKQKNEIKVPLFGDLRDLRRSIIHNHGRAIPEVEHSEVLIWFKEGDPIQLTQDMFGQMVDEVLECLEQIEAHPEQFVVSA